MILQNKIRLISTYIIICKYYFNQSNICFLILKSVTTILLNFSISSYCKGYCQSLLTVFRLSTLEGTSMLHSCFMHLDTHLYCWTHFTQNNESWYRGYRSNCESVTHYIPPLGLGSKRGLSGSEERHNGENLAFNSLFHSTVFSYKLEWLSAFFSEAPTHALPALRFT